MTYDVIIVGGSFAGQSAAMQLARARRKVLVVDGRKPRNRFAEASHGFLGQDGKAPAAIIAEASRQLGLYKTVTQLEGEATEIGREGDIFALTLADGTRRSIARNNGVPKVDVKDPKDPHKTMVLELDDPDNKKMHDVTAYLATVK